MKKAIFIAAVLLIVHVGGASLYVLSARSSLLLARQLLSRDPTEINDDNLVAAIAGLNDTSSKLNNPAVQILRVVPVARQNLSAARTTVENAAGVLSSTLDLKRALEATLEEGVLARGRIDFAAIEDLAAPIARQEVALRALMAEVEEQRSGWLLPPVWDALTELRERVSDIHRTAERARRAVELAPEMVGATGNRTYLLLYLNNAELRGAGGVLTSIGRLSASEGRIRPNDFTYFADLSRDTPKGTVETPSDYARRFNRYLEVGNWINVSASADIPDVAAVAAELYRRARATRVDGAIVIDPRGLQALVPEGTSITVPGTDRMLSAEQLPPFVYSEAYALFADEQPARREALLVVGEEVVTTVLRRGLDRADLERVARAFNEGHLRVVSFHDEEDALLRSVEASGELSTDATDSILVAVQNLGADKLDYWMRRSIDHRCTIGDSSTRCRTQVVLRNITPPGLPEYVTQPKRPYGIYRGYLEIYVPGSADVENYSLNGAPAQTFPEPEDGRLSVGTYIEVEHGRRTTAVIEYVLPVGADQYSLEVTPQPLAQDARLQVRLAAPEGWGFHDSEGERALRHRGSLAAPFRTRAVPESGEGRSGISALWDSLRDFLGDPLL